MWDRITWIEDIPAQRIEHIDDKALEAELLSNPDILDPIMECVIEGKEKSLSLNVRKYDPEEKDA